MDISALYMTHSALLPHVLAGFDPDYSPDEELLSEVRRLSLSPASFFVDPYQLETNVADVARLLDRLLITRRELWDLEAARQRLALSYISTIELAEADAELSVAQADQDKKQDVRSTADAKLAATRRAIEALESRHAQHGGSLNFGERIAKLRNGFRDDIESCHVRSEAIITGLDKRSLPSLSRPKPGELTCVTFAGAGHLDDWAAWHRQLSRRLEALLAASSTFEIAVPLTTSRLVEFVRDDGQHTERTNVVSTSLIDDVKAGRDVDFDLSNLVTSKVVGPNTDADSGIRFETLYRIPRHLGYAALQEVAVQVDVHTASRSEGWQFVVEVRPADSLAGVTLTVDTSLPEPVWIGSPAIANRSARGRWLLRVHSAFAIDAPAKQVHREEWPISEVTLLLRLQGGM